MKHLLFVCTLNKLRSPTAEQIFQDYPGIETASAGVDSSSETPISADLIEWADEIYVMQPAHREKLSAMFPALLKGKRMVCLAVPDNYAFMDPKLIRLLKDRMRRHLPRK